LGLCFGFQLAVVEYARGVIGWTDATSEELGDGRHVIALLPEQKQVDDLGGTMRLGNYPVHLHTGTLIQRLYGSCEIVERHRHRYEVNPAYIGNLEAAGLIFSGRNDNRMECCELADHPFFLATQFHPEFKSRPTAPSPPFIGFVKACEERKRCLAR
jgi:CTP synthase